MENAVGGGDILFWLMAVPWLLQLCASNHSTGGGWRFESPADWVTNSNLKGSTFFPRMGWKCHFLIFLSLLSWQEDYYLFREGGRLPRAHTSHVPSGLCRYDIAIFCWNHPFFLVFTRLCAYSLHTISRALDPNFSHWNAHREHIFRFKILLKRSRIYLAAVFICDLCVTPERSHPPSISCSHRGDWACANLQDWCCLEPCFKRDHSPAIIKASQTRMTEQFAPPNLTLRFCFQIRKRLLYP